MFAGATFAAQRPRYGGTLRVELSEAPQSLDPSLPTSTAPESVSGLVFETLARLDDQGRPQPWLAISWQAEPGNQRWRFQLRRGVSFSDEASMDAEAVAASLRNSNPEWKAAAEQDSVMIETLTPDANVPAELALARNSIIRRSGANLVGTGPFTIAQWNRGQHLSLAANNDYWGGRPFLDGVEIDFGKSTHDQMMALDIGKADLVEVAAENIRRAQAETRALSVSRPADLLALVFTSDIKSDDDAHARSALAQSIDSEALNNVIVQGGGEPTAALLPNWMSGYGFIFRENGAADRARLQVQKRNLSLTLNFDASDPVERLIAQRIQLNARDAGIALQLNGGDADLRLMRIPIASLDSQLALIELTKILGLPPPKFKGASAMDLYAAEKAVLQSYRVIPLLHLRAAMASQAEVHDLSLSPLGTWRLDNVWLSAETP